MKSNMQSQMTESNMQSQIDVIKYAIWNDVIKYALTNDVIKYTITNYEINKNTSLAAPGALANRLQRRTARKAKEANLDPPNQKSEITSL